VAAAVYPQAGPPRRQDLPKAHPPVKSPGQREAASRLTELVAGSKRPGPGLPVPRKNFIDDFIFGQIERDGIPHAPLATDVEFFRRVHLDLTGRIPEPEAVQEFLASPDPQKRDKLVEALVGSEAFLARWTYWFGDLAGTNSNRIGTDGRNLFYRYTYDSFHLNRPYNELVEDLLTTQATSNWYVGPASYLVRWVIIGLTCADTVHEDTSDEITVNVFKHFLGVNLQCISCHDGANHLEKINLWLAQRKRQELWRQAAFLGKTRVLRRVEVATDRDEYSIDDQGEGYDAAARSVVRMPRGGKGFLDPRFLLTGEKPETGKPLRQQLARMVTAHPQFARAAVNAFWAELMGVGIVDPPGEFDLLRLDPRNPPPAPWSVQPTHPDLLEALAKDFRDHRYDLQRLFKLIANSSAYQLSARFPGQWKDSYARYYARKFVRRLKAEEVHDAVVKATGLYTEIPIRGTDLRVRFATQTRSPEDFRPYRDVNYFLEAFGQNNRDYSERSNEGSITQAILLMNSPFIREKVKARRGSHLARLLERQPPLSDDQMTEQLYLRFLSRLPEPDEAAMAKELLHKDRGRGLEDLQWVLMNKVEFLFNQ